MSKRLEERGVSCAADVCCSYQGDGLCHQRCQNFDITIKPGRQAIFLPDTSRFVVLCAFLYAGFSPSFDLLSVGAEATSSVPAHVLLNLPVIFIHINPCIDAAHKKQGGSDDRHFGPVSDLQC